MLLDLCIIFPSSVFWRQTPKSCTRAGRAADEHGLVTHTVTSKTFCQCFGLATREPVTVTRCQRRGSQGSTASTEGKQQLFRAHYGMSHHWRGFMLGSILPAPGTAEPGMLQKPAPAATVTAEKKGQSRYNQDAICTLSVRRLIQPRGRRWQIQQRGQPRQRLRQAHPHSGSTHVPALAPRGPDSPRRERAQTSNPARLSGKGSSPFPRGKGEGEAAEPGRVPPQQPQGRARCCQSLPNLGSSSITHPKGSSKAPSTSPEPSRCSCRAPAARV